MYVASVLFNRNFTAQGKMWYSYKITVKASDGVVYVPEYVFEKTMEREAADQRVNANFPIGSMVKFRCSLSEERCDEIVPLEEIKPGTVAYKPQVPTGNAPHTLIAGQSYSQAMTLAVQMACAECTSLGKEMNMEEIYERAAEIDDWFMKRKEMHGF